MQATYIAISDELFIECDYIYKQILCENVQNNVQ